MKVESVWIGRMSAFLETGNDFAGAGELADVIARFGVCFHRQDLAVDTESSDSMLLTVLQ